MNLMRMDHITRFAGYLLLALLAGCATTTGSLGDKTLLDFLEDGTTSKQTVILKLGAPSGTFEGEKILTYRLGSENEKEYFVLDRQGYVGWALTKFSLVLIFDDRNVLQKHSLVQVR